MWNNNTWIPAHKDDRLEHTSALLKHYRNMMIEADFDDDPSYPYWKQQYEEMKEKVAKGIELTPKF